MVAPPKASKVQLAKDLFRALCNTLRLEVLWLLVSKSWGETNKEQPKVIHYQDQRSQAAVHSLVHLIPVSAGAVLIAFNLQQYYIGGELAGVISQDDQKLAALQFTAKLHELMLLASIGTIIWTYIRWALIYGTENKSATGIPFGVVFAGLGFNSISFLWSLELWGFIYQRWYGGRKKWQLLVLIVICCLLGASLGPSTAILMIPRLGDWPAGGTSFFVSASPQALYPTLVTSDSSPSHCILETGNASCPHGDWKVLNDYYFQMIPRLVNGWDTLPETSYVSSRFSMRTLMTFSRDISLYKHPITLATVPFASIADGLSEVGRLWAVAAGNVLLSKRFRYRKDVRFVVPALQPWVGARCDMLDGIQFTRNAGPFDINLMNDSYVAYTLTSKQMTDFNRTLSAKLPPSITWLGDNEVLRNWNKTLAAIVILSDVANPKVLGCTFDSRLRPSNYILTRNQLKQVSYDLTAGDPFQPFGDPVMMDPLWARYTNPFIASLNSSAFAYFARTANIYPTQNQTEDTRLGPKVEIILAMMLVNGLGRVSYGISMAGVLRGDPESPSDWGPSFLPKGLQGPGGDAYVLDGYKGPRTGFIMSAFVNGYAFSYKGATAKAALAVMTLYILLAVIHSVLMIWNGWYTPAWDRWTQLVVLGFKSEPPSTELENTTAGVQTTAPFETEVRVVQRNNRVQMVFRDRKERKDKPDLTVVEIVGGKVESNQTYA